MHAAGQLQPLAQRRIELGFEVAQSDVLDRQRDRRRRGQLQAIRITLDRRQARAQRVVTRLVSYEGVFEPADIELTLQPQGERYVEAAGPPRKLVALDE